MLLSRDEALSLRSRITVAQVTTRIRNIPTEVPLGPEDGLPKPCVANLDEIMTIPKSVIQNKIGSLSSQKIQAIHRAIEFALALR